jgi:hypothetical protein
MYKHVIYVLVDGSRGDKMKANIKDISIKAFKTFIQGFLGSLVVFIQSNSNIDEKVLKSAFIGALAGGISALMNFIISLLKGDE